MTTLCPCCSYPLLRYVRHGKLCWVCPSCNREMPYGLEGDRPFETARAALDACTALPMERTSHFAAELSEISTLLETHLKGDRDFKALLVKLAANARKLLRVDRAVVFEILSDKQTAAIAESVAPGRKSMLGCRLGRFLNREARDAFASGRIQAVSDLRDASLDNCPTKILEGFFEVAAKLVVPICLESAEGDRALWGLLAVHECYHPRAWGQTDINALNCLADQIGWAVAVERTEAAVKTALERVYQLRDRLPAAPAAAPVAAPASTPAGSGASLPAAPLTAAPPAAVDSQEALMAYVAFYLSRGKQVVSPRSGAIDFNGSVYGPDGYHFNFQHFWQQLQRRQDFGELSIDGDSEPFERFTSGLCEVTACARCQLPIPTPAAAAYTPPACTLCEDERYDALEGDRGGIRPTAIVALGPLPKDLTRLEKLLRDNRFCVTFASDPAQLAAASLSSTVDAIVIHADLSVSQVEAWVRQLRDREGSSKAPIVILSASASHTQPWMSGPVDLVDYLLVPTNGIACTRANTEEVTWFPR